MRTILGSLLLIAAPTGAFAQPQPQPQPLGPIWVSDRNSIVVTQCSPGGDSDGMCRAVGMQRDGHLINLGSGYVRTTVLWRRQPGQAGPDALVLGENGGSGGSADLFGLMFEPSIVVRKISGERMDGVIARSGLGALQIDLPFDIEYFNGAPHAGVTIVRLPIRWADGNFFLDLAALTSASPTTNELNFRALAMEREFHQWAEDRFPAPKLYPPEAPSGTPVAVQALAELMLSGHADQARQLLHRTWPRSWERTDLPLGGEDGFWASLCSAMISHPLWERFDLERVPHAELIKAGAAKASLKR